MIDAGFVHDLHDKRKVTIHINNSRKAINAPVKDLKYPDNKNIRHKNLVQIMFKKVDDLHFLTPTDTSPFKILGVKYITFTAHSQGKPRQPMKNTVKCNFIILLDGTNAKKLFNLQFLAIVKFSSTIFVVLDCSDINVKI